MNQTTNAGIDLDKLIADAAEEAAHYACRYSDTNLNFSLLRDRVLGSLKEKYSTRRAEPSVTAGGERATFPAYKPSAERVLQLIDEARQITDISSSGPISLTLIQIGYIVGHVAAEAARAALASPAVPEGYKLVPIEPTPEMIDNIAAFVDGHENDAEVIYRAMVAAAPAVSQKDGAAGFVYHAGRVYPAREATTASSPKGCKNCDGIGECPMCGNAAITASTSECPSCNDVGWPDGNGGLMECPTCDRAPAPCRDAALSTGQILALERRSNMTDDEAIRFARAVERAVLARAPLPAQDKPVAVRDALRRLGVDTDYHGRIAFTVAQFDQFVSMVAAPAQAGDARDEDGERFRFILAAADNEDGPEAKAMEQFARRTDDDDPRPDSVQMIEAIDNARAAMSASQGKPSGASHASNAGEDTEPGLAIAVAANRKLGEYIAANKPALLLLNDEEMAALLRFKEICEDFDAGGYDVPKEMMKRLAAIGVIESKGFSRYQFTDFGDFVVARRAAIAASAEQEGK
jgi:hypothetical protein